MKSVMYCLVVFGCSLFVDLNPAVEIINECASELSNVSAAHAEMNDRDRFQTGMHIGYPGMWCPDGGSGC